MDRRRRGAAAGRAGRQGHRRAAGPGGSPVCDSDLTLPGHPDILVTGDMMSLDKLPGVAEVAMQTGLYAARKVTMESSADP